MDATPDSTATVAIVLAAGGGTRFRGDGHKLAARLDGDPLATRAIRTAVDAAIGVVVVVTGAADLDEQIASLKGPGIELHTVPNPAWADGQATSLQAGIATATRLGADAVVVGLAAQPFVTVEAWRRVAASRSPIAVATYDGEARPPVRLHASVWPDLPDSGDEGARRLIRLRPELVERIPCPGS
ncbi:MAG: NTP transferase domain-containing protein, partial [Ilumatobacter sp.]|nr:NTP transferase domain-containing protein [Ilumatobacter sp.]